MIMSNENRDIRTSILAYERQIEEMHLAFQQYRVGQEKKMPDWEGMERALNVFSRRRIFDLELSKQLDRVMYKFQNRKKIWLAWVEEYQKAGRIKPG